MFPLSKGKLVFLFKAFGVHFIRELPSHQIVSQETNFFVKNPVILN